MIHTGKDGELIEIGGSCGQLGTEIAKLLLSICYGMDDSGEYEESEVTAWVATVLMSAIIAATDEGYEAGVKHIKQACEMITQSEGKAVEMLSAWYGESEVSS